MSRSFIGPVGIVAGALPAHAFPGTGDQGWVAYAPVVPLLVAIDNVPWQRAALLGGVAALTFWFTTIAWIPGTRVRTWRR